jgi:hypothetical protein
LLFATQLLIISSHSDLEVTYIIMLDSDSPSFDVNVVSSTRVFPESSTRQPTTASLSIIDCTVSRYARCAAIFYNNPPSEAKYTLTPEHLQTALSKTLNAYPQWSGRAKYLPYTPNAPHTQRYRRIQISYNTLGDPGVEFVAATSPKVLSEYVPDTKTRKETMKSWDVQVPSKDLYPPESLSLSDDRSAVNPPNVAVQLTTFACGSTAVSICITHALADAQTLSQFAKDYASVSRALLKSEEPPTLSPVFDPSLLDAFAAGNLDDETPDPVLQAQARSLPCHRYNNYLKVKGQPWPYNMPGDWKKVAHLPDSPSTPIPWHEWDVKAKCTHRILHFTASEITNIYNAATSSPEIKLSKLDTLLAHIWMRINAARNLPPDITTYLDITLGLRSRIEPPLPPAFLGSPILNAAVPTTTSSSPSGSLAQLTDSATQIRQTVQKFSAPAIAALLHDMAFEVSPQRLWRAFLGSHHVLVTSWLNLGLEEVEFLGNGRLRHVEPVMPFCDGLVDILEMIGDVGEGHWSRNGVDVSVYLEAGAMERLLEDPLLWKIEGGSDQRNEYKRRKLG